MSEASPDEPYTRRKDFICGVVEGFYGRPWTTEQRKDLFQKLKKWGMDMYVYAPKDDYKHRAYWRELYTVEEAEHLTSLISAAKEQGIVSQFGCTCFALLFDDIEPEMSESDKQIFQSFAHAQVSITNEIHQHLGCPRFLLCPTQYCSTRAMPTVHSSEYLNTLGTKLSQQIDIMWTGPYCGRSPELIPLLRGVLTNPNCEYNANMIPIRTLGHWAACTLDAPAHRKSCILCANCEFNANMIPIRTLGHWAACTLDAPAHRKSFILCANCEYNANMIPIRTLGHWAACTLDAPAHLPAVPIIPILPSVNTCMSLVTSTCSTATCTTAGAAIPTVTASQLQTLAESGQTPGCTSLVMSTCTTAGAAIPTVTASQLQTLAESGQTPGVSVSFIVHVSGDVHLHDRWSSHPHGHRQPAADTSRVRSNTREIPVSTLPVPIMGIKPLEGGEQMEGFEEKKEDIIVDDTEEQLRNGHMSLGVETDDVTIDDNLLTADDLVLLCELFYLPFEHGARGLRMLHDYNWLVAHRHCSRPPHHKPEVTQWFRGGLTADLRRLLPVECSGELMRQQLVPSGPPSTVRPYSTSDEQAVRSSLQQP
ncbi:Uncharacterized protein OBRU01_16815 [Operophtera brumata]|uniref:GH84 domain-containing protein n=1 Tax=Operophtera brumata TaxID=104452 RepID=A0A0L7L1L4_OPEBR|nr:Uncharacterized protein OBRU01_16815 [Operophtera brumata]